MKPLEQKLMIKNNNRSEVESDWNQFGGAAAFKHAGGSVKSKQRTFSEKRDPSGIAGPAGAQFRPLLKPQSRCESGR